MTEDDLTEEQLAALDKAEAFVNDWGDLSSKTFLLSGCAGSGKTTVMSFLMKRLKRMKVCLTAPTNEAVRVLAEKAGWTPVGTIYALLGLVVKEVDDKTTILERVTSNKIPNYDVVIIDEASMVNDQLFDEIVQVTNTYMVKVIYVGDSHQLPPVNNPSGMSKAFRIKEKAVLTEVKRLTDANPILKVVSEIRGNIFSGNIAFERTSSRTEDKLIGIQFVTEKDKWLSEMLDMFSGNKFVEDEYYVRALAYTNDEVARLNSMIRKRIYGNDCIEYEIGERLIVNQTIMGPPTREGEKESLIFMTGDRLNVLSATESTSSNCKEFSFWTLDVKSAFTGQRAEITVVAEKSQEYYKNLLAVMAENARTGIAKWFDFFKFKKQFANINYSYATTVHKSQGSTFKNVFVNEANLNRLTWDNVELNKLKYVAFTRPSHNLVVYY